jgi:tetratricopeptide (TPR) repeat protein
VLRGLALDPEDEHASALLAMILAERRKKQPALHHGRRSLALAPDDDGGHLALGVTLLQHGHPFQARRHFREALRIDPGPATEEAFLEADRCCRGVYLPMYWWTLALERLPGKNIGAWVLVIGGTAAARALGAPAGVVTGVVLVYVALCIYTWVATPIVKAWVRLVPPR